MGEGVRILLAAPLVVFSAACSTNARNIEKPRQYALRGQVVRLDPKTNVATIHNEKIEGWMQEMTMQFPVENRDEYLALRRGERITATVNVTSEGFWLTNVKDRKE
jgi:Cu/Ag efflux protein CusF